jgi:hypothetical protein
MAFIITNMFYKNSFILFYEKLLKFKNELIQEILNLDNIIKLNEQNHNLHKKSNNELLNITSFNFKEIEKFDQNINERYIKEQNNFCDNQNIFYNKEFEDKIKIVDIKFEDKKYNMYFYKTKDTVSQSIMNNKNYENLETIHIINALNYYSKKSNIQNQDIYIVDIGANIGWYSFLFGIYGYRIIAFEPLELNYYILKKNFCLNNKSNITLITVINDYIIS